MERELRRYLECGILAYGFARARCPECGHGSLVAFSCKGRGICPSCNARHMAETAAHLVDHVFPPLPVRQWGWIFYPSLFPIPIPQEKAMFKKARVPVMLLGLLAVSVLGLSDSNITNAETASAQSNGSTGRAGSLKISAFRDISAFILDLIENQTGFPLEVKYVKNADEAHEDLKQGLADIVFMSYDDTLSIALQDGYSDIAAFMPIHGGILDLCGSLKPAAPRVGIDTDTGYARALRKFLLTELGPASYSQLAWIKAGATDLRYQQLLDGKIDATLLNPPFSYRSGINRITALTGNDVIPTYQGVVANLNRSWLQTPGKTRLLSSFIAAYGDMIASMQNQPEATIARLMSFYQLSEAEATAIYGRLWAADGLSRTTTLDPAALAGTERIFAGDSGITVPGTRTWVLDWDATNQCLDVATIPELDGDGVSREFQ